MAGNRGRRMFCAGTTSLLARGKSPGLVGNMRRGETGEGRLFGVVFLDNSCY